MARPKHRKNRKNKVKKFSNKKKSEFKAKMEEKKARMASNKGVAPPLSPFQKAFEARFPNAAKRAYQLNGLGQFMIF